MSDNLYPTNDGFNELQENKSHTFFEVEIYSDGNLTLFKQCFKAPGYQGHFYRVADMQTQSGGDIEPFGQALKFQQGPVLENGINGLSNEVLIAMLIDRIEELDILLSCEHNAKAKDSLKAALTALEMRTADRVNRGVEGTSKE